VTFTLTPRQAEAQVICAGEATHIMLFGGSRSGKTALLVRNIIMRALKAANSRHVIFRHRFNAVKASVMQDTFPKIMRLAYPSVKYSVNKTDGIATLSNGSELWFAGLDDADRVEKILGMEFVTIYFNECSQIPLASRDVAITRLAQQVTQTVQGVGTSMLRPRVYYDCNPPSKAHWTYRLFIQKIDPDTKLALPNAGDYAFFKINPADNSANVSADYLDTLKGLSARLRKRFLDGEFGDATPGALFTDETIEKWRVVDGVVPEFVRVVVAVDPSGSGDVDNADNDAIGIVVAGLGTDGIVYVLEDCTVKAGPAVWGRIATDAFDRHQADIVVGEVNYGGAMVNATIQTARPRTPFKQVTATRGKAVRAEPFSALYEQGKVRHAGQFLDLESELTSFNTNGYLGGGSPNRADALIWALAELFPAMVAPRKETPTAAVIPRAATAFNRR
jgi:phage terminase large subunit-like protein